MITAPAQTLSRHWWKSSFRLWSYVLAAHIGPFILAFMVTMFVFLLQFLMRFIDKIVGKGLDLWTIIQLITLNLAWMVVLALPMAALVASLMAFGSMASSQELTAMKASGVSFFRMLFPVLIAATALAYADLWFNNSVLPDANHRAKDLMNDIQRKKPTFIMRQGEFSDDGALPGYSIYAKKTFPNSSNLEGVVIFDHTSSTEVKLITAKTAEFTFTRDLGSLILHLHDGEFHQSPLATSDQYRNGVFKSYQVRVPTNGFDFMRQESSDRGDRELSANELLIRVHDRDTIVQRQLKALRTTLKLFSTGLVSSQPDYRVVASRDSLKPPPIPISGAFRQNMFEIQSLSSQANSSALDAGSYLVEVHKKYALPVACLIFVLVGAPLGALAKRGGIGMGVGLSIGFFILYWACLIGGEKLADRGLIAPWTGMWAANIVLGVLGAYLIMRVLSERAGLGLKFRPILNLFRKNA